MSSEDFTKTVVLKRNAKKKSGYTIVEQDGEYFVQAVPAKARVNEGDKVVGINGIGCDEFVDEDDANDLIESIRIVVVPEDQIADYDAAREAEEEGEVKDEESSDEEFEVVERPKIKSKGKKGAPGPESALIVPDNNDEEGDEPIHVLYQCAECGNNNVNAERDEDGDLVCEECGAIIEEDMTRAEKLKMMHNDLAETTAEGQTFGDDGKPKTNVQGKKLTPADMFSPGDVITVTVGKANPKQDAGLRMEEINGKYYVRKVPESGLFAKTPVIAGDKMLELNGTDANDYPTLDDVKTTIKDEERITIVVLRRDPDASVSSASSVDYDNLAAVAPPESDEDEDQDQDDDSTVGYDGNDCGTIWCPQCRPEYVGEYMGSNGLMLSGES